MYSVDPLKCSEQISYFLDNYKICNIHILYTYIFYTDIFYIYQFKLKNASINIVINIENGCNLPVPTQKMNNNSGRKSLLTEKHRSYIRRLSARFGKNHQSRLLEICISFYWLKFSEFSDYMKQISWLGKFSFLSALCVLSGLNHIFWLTDMNFSGFRI